jgi:hypothetical protein
MNTKSAVRTILASVAAGALVLGSAGAATSAPKAKKSPKPSLQVVNIKGHSPLNVWDVVSDQNGVSLRTLKLRATVRDKAKTVEAAATVTIELDAYTKKVNGVQIDGFEPISVTLTPKATKSKVNRHYEATHVFTAEQAAALVAAEAAPGRAYLCISDADVVGYDAMSESKQTQKRLGKRGKAVRDCVKIVNLDPTTTKTTKDDGIPTS